MAVLDLLSYAQRIPAVHGLLEIDVTRARGRLAQRQDGASFTALLLASVALAVRAHPEVNMRRAGRRLVAFDPVDIVVTVEQRQGGISIPVPHVIRDAGARSFDELAGELAGVRERRDRNALRTSSLLERMPSPARRLGVRIASRFPAGAARLGPTIGISSLGMFGSGIAWAIPVSPLTLMVTVGSIGKRLTDGGELDVLSLTLSFDHTVIDGAPAARFASSLAAYLESATVLDAG